MAKILLLKLLVILLLINIIKCDDEPEQCIKLDNDYCKCRFNDGRIIDLSKLFENGKDTPENRFLEADKLNYRYFFHGCNDDKFKPTDYNIESTVDLNATLPVEGSLILYQNWIEKKGNDTILRSNLTVLGKAPEIEYHVLPNKLAPYELIYKNKTDGSIKASFRLICENFEKPYIQIVDDPQSKQFTLNSPHACVYHEDEGKSLGATLLTLFIFVCLIYFIGGGCFLYFARGARGIELIPNIDFWKKLPGLVRDGTLFLFGGCNPRYISTSEVYDRI